jgi:hypothetical protein
MIDLISNFFQFWIERVGMSDTGTTVDRCVDGCISFTACHGWMSIVHDCDHSAFHGLLESYQLRIVDIFIPQIGSSSEWTPRRNIDRQCYVLGNSSVTI